MYADGGSVLVVSQRIEQYPITSSQGSKASKRVNPITLQIAEISAVFLL